MTEDAEDVAGRLADLNAYGKALNRAAEEEQVVSLCLEAMSLLLELPRATFVDVRDGVPVVADSTEPERTTGEDAGPVASRAAGQGEIVREAGSEPDDAAAAAVPVVHDGDVVAVLLARDTDVGSFDEETLRPLEILATHAATALGNIRSREEMERTQRTLTARAELLDLYGRLFRHHLRNDLNIVAGYAEMLADGTDDADAKLATIRETVERSIDLVDRVGSLHVEIDGIGEPEPRSLGEAVASAVEAATERYDTLSVDVDPADVDYQVLAGGGIESVFSNLLENAVLHNEGPVSATVVAESPDADVVAVTVSDDGRGIPESARERVFQLGETGPESDRIGLGLGFVRRLVETYGGHVTYEESSTGGAAFRIELERA